MVFLFVPDQFGRVYQFYQTFKKPSVLVGFILCLCSVTVEIADLEPGYLGPTFPLVNCVTLGKACKLYLNGLTSKSNGNNNAYPLSVMNIKELINKKDLSQNMSLIKYMSICII